MFPKRCCLLLLMLWGCEATANLLAAPALDCTSPAVNPAARYFSYRCYRNDSAMITINILKDDFINVVCGGHFTCAEFPRVRPEDAGDTPSLDMSGCGADISVECALAGVNVPVLQLQTIRLKGAPLMLQNFTQLNDIEFYRYGEDNEDWLPMQQLQNLHKLKHLTVSSGRTRLHQGQWDYMTQLETLEFLNTLNDFPPLLFKNLHQLKSITMGLNDFKTLTADHFEGLDNLDKLSLYYNNIQYLSSNAFQHLKSLTFLDLNDNNLKEIYAGTFNNLISLQQLRLRGNRHLGSLDKDLFIGLSALRELSLSDCSLLELPAELIRPLTSLATIDLSYNKLRSLPPYFFKSNSKLVGLKLDYNELVEMKSESVAGAWNLKTLLLNNNKLNFADITNISPFHELKKLERLNLNNNYINQIFCDWRVTLLKLRELDLGYNNFTGFLAEKDTLFSQRLTVNLCHNKLEGVFAKTSPLNPGEAPRSCHFLLDGNPFVCDSRLQSLLSVLRDYARGGGITYNVGNAVCAAPPELVGTPLMNVNITNI